MKTQVLIFSWVFLLTPPLVCYTLFKIYRARLDLPTLDAIWCVLKYHRDDPWRFFVYHVAWNVLYAMVAQIVWVVAIAPLV